MSDASLRFLVTLSLLALFFGLEFLTPARPSALTPARMGRHFGLALTSAILARLALGGGLAGVALIAQSEGWGLFNLVTAPHWLAIGASFLMLDLIIWAQHVALHRVPFLWRLHRVHHSDVTMDVTTALRFHPAEILASLALKSGAIMLIGAPPQAVLAFEIVLGAGALFTHANIALPNWIERRVRFLLVTPSLHMIHHSPNPVETNSNFGFSFSFWDRVFGTYRDARLDDGVEVGLETWRGPQDQSWLAMLANPLRNP